MPVSVIGMGLSVADLTETHLNIIRHADVLIGAKRHLDCFENAAHIRKKEIGKDIQGLIGDISAVMADQSVAVLASGDPLFYGIGNLLIRSLGPENVAVYPNITSVAGAFSRIRDSWHDAAVVSMHGRRDEQELADILVKKDKIAVLTDPEKNPAWLAAFLLSHHITDFDMGVFEQLGSESERVGWYSLSEAVSGTFSDPNLVILRRNSDIRSEKNADSKQFLHIGMPEECFDHENGLITKAEVRAVSISKLCLDRSDYILWDLGAGSGSVSVEASLFLKQGRIFAAEKNPERIRQIETNKQKYGAVNIEIIRTELPDGMDSMPRPDRIFIGGGGSQMKNIIQEAAAYLKPGGVMVINTVLIQNLDAAFSELQRRRFTPELVQLQVSRHRKMPWGERLEAQNPVWIITGRKPEAVLS